MIRQRLDQTLVTRNLAPTRARARDLVKRGAVRVAGVVETRPAALVDVTTSIAVAEDAGAAWVSRGALKLMAGLAAFGFDPRDRIALDLGASTGGFTEVLLANGARRVYAVDVGHGQLHPRVCSDVRVAALEGQDARTLSQRQIPEPVTAITADLSFISLTKALPTALALAGPDAWLVALVKPQFEVGRAGIGKGGIVRNTALRDAAVATCADWLAAQPDWCVMGAIPSPLMGGDGNREFLLGARRKALVAGRDNLHE